MALKVQIEFAKNSRLINNKCFKCFSKVNSFEIFCLKLFEFQIHKNVSTVSYIVIYLGSGLSTGKIVVYFK